MAQPFQRKGGTRRQKEKKIVEGELAHCPITLPPLNFGTCGFETMDADFPPYPYIPDPFDLDYDGL